MRYLVLLLLKAISLTFYRFDGRWLTPQPPPPWKDLRLIALLNHTSLFEWLFVGVAPNHLLRRIAKQALVPIAEETVSRPLVGRFFRILAPDFIPITRRPDHTWEAVLESIDPESLVVILPEGRMMRADGLDKHGRPMTVRGGIADIIRVIPEGRMLLGYSGGLHHVQVPGQGWPKLFREIRIALELVDIEEYRNSFGDLDPKDFKSAVRRDLERRRDELCPR